MATALRDFESLKKRISGLLRGSVDLDLKNTS